MLFFGLTVPNHLLKKSFLDWTHHCITTPRSGIGFSPLFPVVPQAKLDPLPPRLPITWASSPDGHLWVEESWLQGGTLWSASKRLQLSGSHFGWEISSVWDDGWSLKQCGQRCLLVVGYATVSHFRGVCKRVLLLFVMLRRGRFDLYSLNKAYVGRDLQTESHQQVQTGAFSA